MAVYRSLNPARLDDVVATVSLASPDEFVAACRAARAAQPGWARVPAPVRGQVVGNLGRLVRDNFEALAQLVTREVGKPIAEARGEKTVRSIPRSTGVFLSKLFRSF